MLTVDPAHPHRRGGRPRRADRRGRGRPARPAGRRADRRVRGATLVLGADPHRGHDRAGPAGRRARWRSASSSPGRAGCSPASRRSTAQLTSGARAARSIAILALGVAWVLRLAGDIAPSATAALSWLSWLSPIGWVQHIFPYGGDRWWPVVLAVIFTAGTTWAGVALRARRDLGAGLLPDRLGPASAAPGPAVTVRAGLAAAPRSAVRVARRVRRARRCCSARWRTASADLAERATRTCATIFARMGGAAALVDSYFASTAGLLGLIAAGYAVQATLRLRDEETTGHAEMVLTSSVTRLRWAASHLVFSLLGAGARAGRRGSARGLDVRARSARRRRPARP